jgi:PHP family Zn ribbon phosphoesterase
MKFAYDFHIHTAASPCADEYMSPHNIINMSQLNGLQVIAITDHNICANCEVIMEIGRQNNILVIPGMEIECMEEFHCIALFKDMESARYIENYVTAALPALKNRTEIFGNQYWMNEKDEVIGEIDRLLLTATARSAEELFKEVRGAGGIIYPAHIDRNSHSIITTLGCIPEELNLHTIEISKGASLQTYEQMYKGFTIIQSSDAHYLQDISQSAYFMEAKSLTISDIFKSIEQID